MQKLEYDRDEIIRAITAVDETCGKPSVSREYITVKLFAKRAMFAQPQFRVNKKTYKIPPFSTIRNALQSIYAQPGMNWVPVFCGLRNPIKIETVATNGLQFVDRANPQKPINASSVNQKQLFSTEYLRDVEYYIKAYIVTRPNYMGQNDSLSKFNEIAKRRIEKGQCYENPCLGPKECVTYFAPIDDSEWMDPNLFQDITEDCGYMPFDFKYNNGETHIPMYKHMMVQKGKIFYLNGEVVL